mmetsp:Transcript_21098/g.54467  ORF Transcript_21098/g.54467 Transcript_21098/m.54467 type:complete len:102 (-) Transcript_21098:153-458(-)
MSSCPVVPTDRAAAAAAAAAAVDDRGKVAAGGNVDAAAGGGAPRVAKVAVVPSCYFTCSKPLLKTACGGDNASIACGGGGGTLTMALPAAKGILSIFWPTV